MQSQRGYYRGWVRLGVKIGFPDTGPSMDTIVCGYYRGWVRLGVKIGFPDTVLAWVPDENQS